MNSEAIIFGATGAVGSELLHLCLTRDHYSRVTVIARGPATLSHEKLHWTVADYDALDELAIESGLENGDAFCCLGTTIKTAGSEAAFRRVDYDYVLNSARYAKKCGVNLFSLITAIGANANSRVLYSRTKGEIEAAVLAENFSSLQIFRPALLKGPREEIRIKEELANGLSWLLTPIFHFGLSRYKPVEIKTVARAMYKCAQGEHSADSSHFFESEEIQKYRGS